MHILVRVLLILLSLPLLLFIVMAPLAAFKNIGVFATFILFGSVGVILASMAILTPRDKVPDQTLTGIPDDSDLPKGGIATRFWQGLFGNIPAAIVIDTNQHNILFVSCLGHHGSTGSRKPHVLLGKKDIDGVYEIISRSKSGFQEVSLHIITKEGRVKLRDNYRNFEQIRYYFLNNYPKLSKLPLGILFTSPVFFTIFAPIGILVGYQIGISLGEYIHARDPELSEGWGLAGAIFGPVFAILICYGLASVVDNHQFNGDQFNGDQFNGDQFNSDQFNSDQFNSPEFNEDELDEDELDEDEFYK